MSSSATALRARPAARRTPTTSRGAPAGHASGPVEHTAAALARRRQRGPRSKPASSARRSGSLACCRRRAVRRRGLPRAARAGPARAGPPRAADGRRAREQYQQLRLRSRAAVVAGGRSSAAPPPWAWCDAGDRAHVPHGARRAVLHPGAGPAVHDLARGVGEGEAPPWHPAVMRHGRVRRRRSGRADEARDHGRRRARPSASAHTHGRPHAHAEPGSADGAADAARVQPGRRAASPTRPPVASPPTAAPARGGPVPPARRTHDAPDFARAARAPPGPAPAAQCEAAHLAAAAGRDPSPPDRRPRRADPGVPRRGRASRRRPGVRDRSSTRSSASTNGSARCSSPPSAAASSTATAHDLARLGAAADGLGRPACREGSRRVRGRSSRRSWASTRRRCASACRRATRHSSTSPARSTTADDAR